MVRASPVLVGFIIMSLAITLADFLYQRLEPELFADPDALWPAWYAVMLLGAVGGGIVAGMLANIRFRKRELTPRAARILTRGLPLAVLLIGVPDYLLGLSDDVWLAMALNAGTLVLVLLVIRLGIGTLLVWSLRQAATQSLAIVQLAARVLPMILLLTLFAFLSAGLWEVTGALARNELWKVVLILVAIAAFFAWAAIRDEMRSAMEQPHPDLRERLASQFPSGLAGLGEEELGPSLTLSRQESLNATALLFIAQMMQITALVVLVFAFFCLFGSIAVPPSVVLMWTGHVSETSTLMGIELPVHEELVQASLVLAAFSSVSFAASSVTDPSYRKRFFEPMLQEVMVTIAARHLYRTSQRASRMR